MLYQLKVNATLDAEAADLALAEIGEYFLKYATSDNEERKALSKSMWESGKFTLSIVLREEDGSSSAIPLVDSSRKQQATL